jgi:hypothetical protein
MGPDVARSRLAAVVNFFPQTRQASTSRAPVQHLERKLNRLIVGVQKMSLFSKILPVLFVASGFFGLVGRSIAAPEIRWEVENRFRFYQTPGPFKAYLKVAKETRPAGIGNWILHTEQKLQQKHLDEASAKERSNGWASRSMDDTCWDRGGFVLIDKDRCEDYTLPGSHRVLLSVTGVDTATARCTVKINVVASQTPKQFNQKRRTELFNKRRKEIEGQQSNVDCLDIPVEVPFSTAGDAGVEATVTLTQSGSSTDLTPVRIVVNDLLVLGMGDSFAAGVGNPDRPSQIRPNGGIIYDGETAVLPVRQNGFSDAGLKEIGAAQAKWLDIRCFRSQYGPQFRAALHLAVDMPHSAVTFLDLACDGARIIEGLLHRKELDAGYDPDTIDDPEAQLGRASRLLCASEDLKTVRYRIKLAADASKCGAQKPDTICEFEPEKFRREAIDRTSMKVCGRTGADAFRRNIDVLLLSIGGNDIGFAPMVGNILLGDVEFSDRLLRYLATEVGQIHPAGIGKTRLEFLHDKYRVLDQAIDKYLPLRPGSSKPVFLTAYPLPVDDRQGALCGGSDASASAARDALDSNSAFDGFTSPPSAAFKRLKEVVNTSCLLNIRRIGWFNAGADADSVLQQLTEAGKPCAGMAANADTGLQKIDWQFEFALLEKWHGHGFCAVRSGEQAGSALSVPKADSFNVFTPPLDRMRAYDSRQRWVRTPNDAFMITNWQTFSPKLRDSVNLLVASTTSAMHPTAEGYASMADSLRGRVARYVCSERAGEFGSEPLCASP